MTGRGVQPDDHRYAAYLILAGLVTLLAVMVAVAVTSLGAGEDGASSSATSTTKARRLPVYWTVRSGDSYTRIARRTGLTVSQLEQFNPDTDPSAIVPGQRLKLRANVPEPKRKPQGPKYYTLRAGDSFGSVAAKTGRDITKLMRLNPKLKPSRLQPGDRLRLR